MTPSEIEAELRALSDRALELARAIEAAQQQGSVERRGLLTSVWGHVFESSCALGTAAYLAMLAGEEAE